MKYLALLAILIGAPASAEVVNASANGFEVRETVPLVVPPDDGPESAAAAGHGARVPPHGAGGKSRAGQGR